MEALTLSLTPSQAPKALHTLEETWYADMAHNDFGWTAAHRTPECGMRICHLQPRVTTQQGAELVAIELATKTCVSFTPCSITCPPCGPLSDTRTTPPSQPGPAILHTSRMPFYGPTFGSV